MKPYLVAIFALTFSYSSMAQWVEYAIQPNGDVFYFDDSRVENTDEHISVWTRVRYKTSIMGASSYQSRLQLNCAEKSEMIVQSTFYSDENWSKPAMATNTNAKPETKVQLDSATSRLVDILCKA